ncbi:putative DNA-binding transcriptional regulator YafY [Anaerosolibacter carboniphilus]|uniref:Putative DNA-binding transcriptional regulator YafY n=1 Tax=Anaerosolibacter carboniphilus TaxID=1417629 RepID=A0A841KML1_9FIRM|nr:YafY family protein [Anaerosolibacter carboniphilus]MBB6214501.1 putative DNA-binding transcriptional regulator YafY [Anaerosolibacter carboniphilus]
MKIDRLISIIMVLLERKKISATKLAEMFEVTPRTIYRDIETISLAGIPIVTYPGANGGIGIMEEYKLDKKLFTTSDITTLLIGLGSISSTLSSEEIVNTLAKVKGLIPAEQFRDIELKSSQITIDLTPWAGNKNLQPNLEQIKRALNESKCLSFKYSDRSGKKSSRKVEPYKLVLKETNWYLQGYCISKKDFRTFKLSRISALEIMEEMFIPREFHAKPLGEVDWIKNRSITIKLLVDESLRERMVEHCGEENIEPDENNKLIVHFPFVEDELGYNLLLSFGDKCECLEPENIRMEVIQRIKKILEVYKQ